MTDTEIVPREPDRPPASKPAVDAALADELLARAQTERVELLGPDGLLSQEGVGRGDEPASGL